jgi:RND family efflux transporter MFP subunit
MSEAKKADTINYWQILANAKSIGDMAIPWLAIQGSWIPGYIRGALMLWDASKGSFKVIARWPEGDGGSDALKLAAEKAVKEGKGVVQFAEDNADHQQSVALSYPLQTDGQTVGVVVCEIAKPADSALRNVMRQMQWGKVWLEFALYREKYGDNLLAGFQSRLALDGFVRVLDAGNADSGMQGLVSLLASHFGCDRVSIGLPGKTAVTVRAVSNSFKLGERQDLVRMLGDAMDEAADQHVTIITGPAISERSAPVIDAQIRHMEEADVETLLCVPVFNDNELVGVMAFEWPKGVEFKPEFASISEAIAQISLPLISFRVHSERSAFKIWYSRVKTYFQSFLDAGQNRRRFGWSTFLVAIIMMVLVDGNYRVTSDARLEGSVQRSIVAGIDGYILSQHARAGDRVKKGDVLARLDTKDLVLENLRWTAQKQQYLAEASKALAEHNRSANNVARTQVQQADAQIKLIAEQLRRTTLIAPYDGIVVTGDLSQSVGAAVRRGDLLFEVAPLDTYRVALFVDERDIGQIRPGQSGTLVSPARPDNPVTIEVTRITPISDARDGQTVFRVEAKSEETLDWMQPGLEGIAKVDIGRRNLVWIWTHRFTDWLRLTFWTWMP